MHVQSTDYVSDYVSMYVWISAAALKFANNHESKLYVHVSVAI